MNRPAEINNVSGTAFVVAEFRAEENNEVHPLYRDSIVRFFLNEDSKQAAGRIAASFPPAKDLVKIRTKYFDDMLERQILSGCRQVVLLELEEPDFLLFFFADVRLHLQRRNPSDVAEALRADDDRKRALIRSSCPRYLQKEAEEFAAMTGTRTFDSFASRESLYLSLVAKKKTE